MRYTLGEATSSIQTVEAAIAAGMNPLQVSGDTFYFETWNVLLLSSNIIDEILDIICITDMISDDK